MTTRSLARSLVLSSLALSLQFLPSAASGQPNGGSAPDTNANWTQFHFSADHKGVNPLETILDSSNVSGLHEVWTGMTEDMFGLASPVVARGIAYIGSYDGHLYAFDAVTGDLLWRAGSGDIREATPAVARGMVFSLVIGGRLSAFDADNGRYRWSIQTSAAISSPTVAGGKVFVGGTSVEAHDLANGALLWSTPLPENTVASVSAKNDRLFAVGGHFVYSLDAETGAIVWQKNIDVFQVSSPAIANGMVYVGDFSSGFVYALRAGNGSVAWKFDTQGGLPDSSPAVVDGVVYIGDYSHDAVWALNAETGARIWRSTGGGSQGSVSVANGVVYAASYWGNTMYAFDATTGVTLWSSPLPGHSQSTPAIVNGMVYVGADDGGLHAYSL